MKCFWSLIVFLFFPLTAWADYASLYDRLQTFNYTTNSGIFAIQQRTGYRYEYNLDDPIIRCAQEDGLCAYLPIYAQYCQVDGELARFKVYIPPGTITSNLTIYISGQISQYAFVARLGQPISLIPSIDDNYFDSLPMSGFSQSQLLAGDCVGKNAAGIMAIAGGNMSVATEADGGWLYVVLIRRTGNMISTQFNNRISTDPFMAWFRNVDWTNFGSAGSIINPDPAPMPASTPNPSGCAFGCGTGATCVNGVCIMDTPSPTPYPDGCNDILCLFQGGRCLNGSCVIPMVTPPPTPTPTPNPEVYIVDMGGIEATISILAGSATISVNGHVYPSIPYSEVDYGTLRVLKFPGNQQIEIIGDVASLFDVPITLNRKNR